MKKEDFTFHTDDNGTAYITYSEGMTKTRQNGLHQKDLLHQPNMPEVNHEQGPVKILKNHLSKQPVDMRNSGPFYLEPIANQKTDIWFKRFLMNIYSINSIRQIHD